MIGTAAQKDIVSHLTQTQILQGALDFCKTFNFGLAAWRLPDSSDIHILIDDSENQTFDEVPIEEQPEGFIFSPFEKEKKKVYLKASLKINLTEARVTNSKKTELLDKFEKHLKHCHQQSNSESTQSQFEVIDTASGPYESLVAKAVSAIQDGKFQKVVPSRFKEIQLNQDFCPASHFLKLENEYKKSFISLVYSSKTNLWIGATPEILIQTRGNIFTTVALAGTQAYDPQKPISDTSWTQKEIEEQAFVSRYIINSFKKIRLREFDEHGPKTVVAGNLLHLKTAFTVDMQATNFPQLGSVMLDLLHPTSAICGMPLDSSYQFLKQHENYDRKFFAGYLGPVNDDEGTSIFVNLRCMEIDESTGRLYAGAGVTEDSNPHKEWLETEMKMNTLLNIIKL
ncbi:isochorismate synthase [Fulvivirga sp. RKSG066]|uniref:chorismate-binding protein n=1 Tax=Fulvivirga aurantia TaxID=2529383 RepID=UPI0012BCDB26|nr:chorismate-binding protein [Fulvivirga aurantia]MTI22791.1 isochorismate synthase [Fulvivirga aurantia]